MNADDFVITSIRCEVNSNFEMSKATVTCTGCRGFNDSISLLRENTSTENPWCVHVLSAMKAYESILTTQETSETVTVATTNSQRSTFQSFIQRSFNDNRPMITIRVWGEKTSFFVLADVASAYVENVPTHSVCIIRQVTPNLRLLSCSNVTCQKGKNKKIKKNKITSDCCCHLRQLLTSIESLPVQSNFELDDSDDSDDDLLEGEGQHNSINAEKSKCTLYSCI